MDQFGSSYTDLQWTIWRKKGRIKNARKEHFWGRKNSY